MVLILVFEHDCVGKKTWLRSLAWLFHCSMMQILCQQEAKKIISTFPFYLGVTLSYFLAVELVNLSDFIVETKQGVFILKIVADFNRRRCGTRA